MAEKAITADERRDALVEKIFADSIAFMEILGVYLGDKLGLYAAMSDGAWVSAPELASRAKVNERYAREWLEFQAVSGILEAEDDSAEGESAEPLDRRHRIPEGHGEVLLDRDSLAYVVPLAKQMAGLARPLPALVEAMKSGGGVSFPEYGEDIREGIEFGNRAMFVNLMGEWLGSVPDLHERLSSDVPARVADIGCGSGWSSISIAKAYPNARVDGLDLDGDSIAAARRNAAKEGLEERLSFQLRDASDPDLSGAYDLAIAIECIHDMSRPVEALRAMHSLVAGESGTAIVVDERVGDEFAAPGDEAERLYYGFSVLHCLPVGMSEQPSAETGTVMRTATLREYAREAGFSGVEVLPVENDMWRFYRLLA